MVPLAAFSAAACSRSLGESGVGVPICASISVLRHKMKGSANNAGNIACGVSDFRALRCAPGLLLIQLIRANLFWLYLQLLVKSTQLLFHILVFLVEFHFLLGVFHPPDFPVQGAQSIMWVAFVGSSCTVSSSNRCALS